MNLGAVVGLFADVHGAHRTLRQALTACRVEGVETIALLGDLIDRTEQADACAQAEAGAALVGIELRRMYGAQDTGFAMTLPVGLGLPTKRW